MPLFVPFLLGGLSLLAGLAGVGATIDAIDKFDMANSMVNDAKDRFRRKKSELDYKRTKVYRSLEKLGELKKDIFESRGKRLLELIENSKTSAEIKSYEIQSFIRNEVPQLREDVIQLSGMDLSLDASGSIVKAALGATGIYHAVMAFGTASTGTAISTLSGAAATNATLAWLGGGSLAAGGFGMAGGTMVLGGLIAGPAIAIMGFSLNTKSEKALTEAKRYSEEVNIEIARMNRVIAELSIIENSVGEIENILNELVRRFDKLEMMYHMATDVYKRRATLENLILTFKTIKMVVNEPIIDDKGAAIIGLKEKIYAKIELSNINLAE